MSANQVNSVRTSQQRHKQPQHSSGQVWRARQVPSASTPGSDRISGQPDRPSTHAHAQMMESKKGSNKNDFTSRTVAGAAVWAGLAGDSGVKGVGSYGALHTQVLFAHLTWPHPNRRFLA